MPKNTIRDLRDHLFETIEALKDPESPMEIERAKAISGVAQTIINSAMAEIKLLEAVNGSAPASKKFFDFPEEDRLLPAGPGRRL